jgi:citrate lyase beta subunit
MLVTGADARVLDAAVDSSADVVCLDLEDTVEDKAGARRLAEALLARDIRAETAIRINPLTTEDGLHDLLWLCAMQRKPKLVMMTMVLDPFEVQLVARMLPGVELVVIIETAEALESAAAMARAAPSVSALLFGGKDLALSLRCTRNWEGLAYGRGRVAHAAALAGVDVFDEVFHPLNDYQALATACEKARVLGYSGKMTIGLGQIPIINDGFQGRGQ